MTDEEHQLHDRNEVRAWLIAMVLVMLALTMWVAIAVIARTPRKINVDPDDSVVIRFVMATPTSPTTPTTPISTTNHGPQHGPFSGTRSDHEGAAP